MSKSSIVLLVVVVAVALPLGWYLLARSPSPPADSVHVMGIDQAVQARGVKKFRRIATALWDVVCVMTRMDGSADFSG